jgi:hypothetical protein
MIMKKKFYYLTTVLLILFLAVSGCSEDPIPSLYELADPGRPAPVINSISPDEGIAVVTPLTITGQNFSPVPEENVVYFSGKPGTVLTSSETQLVVTSANVISDTTQVKVRVRGSEAFSNIIRYKLTPPVMEILNDRGDPLFSDLLRPYGITLDNQNNLYVSTSGTGIKKITPEGILSDFAPKGPETFWASLKFGPSATIYASQAARRGVWKVTEGVIPGSQPWVIAPTNVSDFDLDANLNAWGVSTNSLVLLTQAGTAKGFPITGTLRSVRVFNNAVYVAGLRNTIEGVWRFPLAGPEDLGAEELYFNYTEFDNSSRINVITFSAEGDLLIGTNRNEDPIVIVRQDKSANVLYKGAITRGTEVLNFSWDMGNFLYFTRNANGPLTQTVIKVNMERPSAPYFGRN